ncbi:Uncharacterised protein [Burkholderia pseudomallei]|uniref:hypothetical protein n=1 Tax=pseudomallei group TaxID=111527 RepID=UPI00030FEF2C|nr:MULTISPECIES: hypothetical protein [pseudomallei group]AIV76443.1 putative gp19 [Burkholderia pseudomallei]AJX84804.1 putative gp19 [Burkholderia pseudomallei 7894]APY94896.1 hypothetical protein BGI50_17955 [Burkholderia pseudomallei]ARK42892.1 hypothetical protein BOC60_21780 [Burkholderia pseudomallei]ARK71259.1 hypothetical protein BOC38_32935 [Burkholderia pseudomallei]
MKRLHDLARGPVLSELLAGLRRIRAEFRRAFVRVTTQCQLRRIERDERRAMHDLAWMERDLHNAKTNFVLLQGAYANRRRALYRRLKDTATDRTGGSNAAS